MVSRKVTELKPYENNPRINDKAVDAVAASIKEFGFKVPIIVDKDGVIIAGHTRLKAAEKLGLEEVPVIVADDLTPAQVKAFRLADNKVSELADWDFNKLEEELKNIEMDMSAFNFDMKELSRKFDKNKEVIEDNFDVEAELEKNKEPKVKRGQIWKLGNHYLMCGDATSKTDVEKLMGGEKADLVFTDPPYGISVVGENGKVGADNLAKNGIYMPVKGDETTKTTEDFIRVCKELGYEKQIIFGGNYFIQFLPFSDSWLIWDKRGDMASNNFADGEMAWCSFHTPVRIYKQVWSGMIKEDEHGKRVHPTQKPVKMLADILKDFSAEDELVFDGFGGSGSVLIACEQTGRRCRMIEYEPYYCDVIIKRWETLTGRKAKLNK